MRVIPDPFPDHLGKPNDARYSGSMSWIWQAGNPNIVAHPFEVICGVDDGSWLVPQCIITVPAGFLTDFASVPAFVRGMLGKDMDRTIGPAVVHDFLYTMLGYSNYQRRRKFADQLFEQLLIKAGLSKQTAKGFYTAVRWFGKSPHAKNPGARFISNDDPRLHQ